MVEKINEQDADLVVIAGDICDNEWEAVDDPDRIAETLRGIDVYKRQTPLRSACAAMS